MDKMHEKELEDLREIESFKCEVSRRLFFTAKKFGVNAIECAVVIGCCDTGKSTINGKQYVYTSSQIAMTLGNVDYKVARFFEGC